MRVLRVSLLVALALAAAGCGAKKEAGSVPAGAEFAPASVPLYVSVSTDPNGSQWKVGERLLNRFPGREKVFAGARKDLQNEGLDWDRDVKPALPTAVHFVLLDFANSGHDVVGYAKPNDEAKFNKLLESGDTTILHRKVDGWTVFAANNKLLDRFASARASGDSLAQKKSFRDAIAKLPADAALRGWVDGASAQDAIDRQAGKNSAAKPFQNFSKSFGTLESASFAAKAEDEGIKVEAVYELNGGPKTDNFAPRLDEKLPPGALLYLSFGNLEDFFNKALASADKSVPDFKTQRAEIEQAMGFSLKKDLFPLFSREGAVAVHQGTELTTGVTFLLDVKGDEDKARNVVTRLGALLKLGGQGKVTTLSINGVEVSHLGFKGQPFELFVAVSDDVLMADSSEFGIRSLLGGGKKLVDDPVYKQAREASGAPDDTVGFFYANLEQGLTELFDFIEMSSGERNSDARANTKPLRSTFFYAKRDGDRTTVSGFLTIK